ncbi:NAD(P)/FAD-dependent oxidoreductase [Manganibacter manganicus]|uniref:FAD-dependent oxidoreductase n=1 Tax=Manganibacter manganicus TaxID=1873176 RepID=A0A1V8RP63_9HYPH|nr:NAD(P)/FAD-dependent oxidoreductase [Pseudaminobacter manganicus]OQM74980.1 FAD-dependent oxidoreductase [Pseudaminobacter manganicus]
MLDIAPTKQATTWLGAFARALEARDIDAAMQLFLDDCYWRDLLAFSWNIKTVAGRDAVSDMLGATIEAAQACAFHLSGEATVEDGTVEAWFTFETAAGHGKGCLRLRNGKCRTLFTATDELKGFEEKKGPQRPLGVKHRADPNRETWSEKRRREERELGTLTQPYCVVIGGGQGGMMLGARLRQLGVPTVILEKNARPGDSWRNRYRSLVLHDPVWYDHLPYIPFPDNWPVFTPKDQMGDWLEMYAKVMELHYWTSSSCTGATYDAASKTWTVEVDRDGERVVLKPKQLVFATGAYGPPRMIDLPGSEAFQGEILHSSQYADGSRFRGKACAVIGAASSGHDVSVDLWESGAKVTMIQRSPTTVAKSATLMALAFDTYSEDALARGITTDNADWMAASTPFALMPETQKPLYDKIRARDAEFYERLAGSGFAIDFGEDETGLMMKAVRTGSGYYIDVGASDLIIDGEIGVVGGTGIKALTPTGILFEDGRELAADVIIACTGYQSMHETVAQLVSREAADRIGPCWGLGSGVKGDPGPWKGDPRNMWKPTAHEALWFHGGNLALSRFYSKFVAMQIKARMEGIPTSVYGEPG